MCPFLNLLNSIVLMLGNNHKKQFAWFYLLCLFANFAWLFYNNLLLYQVSPLLFINRLDITRNVIMLSGIQQLLVSNHWLCILFDMLFLLLPALLSLAIFAKRKEVVIISLAASFVALIYGVYITGFSYLSIEMYIPWMLMPLVFCNKTDKGFYFSLHTLRIIFLLIFFSAGLWKLRAGGVFNAEQMSGILLEQHKQMLVSDTSTLFTDFIKWLIVHPKISYLLYLVGLIAELLFVIGFFTRRYDRVLCIAFIGFLISDLLLMQINYFNWLVFAGLLFFSKFKLSENAV